MIIFSGNMVINVKKTNRIVWDKEIKAFVDTKTGRLIAPRLDEDGIDLFFVEKRDDKHARARYCCGEGYWAFPWTEEKIKKIREDFKELIEYINQFDEDDIIKLLSEDEISQ